MKIKMLKKVVADKQPRNINDIIDVEESEGKLLISYGMAEETTEVPAKAKKIKK